MRCLAILLVCALPLLSACGPASHDDDASQIFASDPRYPSTPNLRKTPGSLCTKPDEFRYPEQIAYCERDVETELKYQIIREYDREFGYHISDMNRHDFKIDHYIPLCMGGSNEKNNLWPQHKSIYADTDPIEPMLCELMKRGVMLQAEAVEIIREAKGHPTECDAIARQLQNQM